MGTLYLIGRGHLKDDKGKSFHKGSVIDFDNFTYLKDREKKFVKNGTLIIPGKQNIKKSEEEKALANISKKETRLENAIIDFVEEKAEFKKMKSDFEKEISIETEKLRKEKEDFLTMKSDFEKDNKKKKE